jgi:light-regulated signal transduction histidine kinase (bacteriophytochrome)
LAINLSQKLSCRLFFWGFFLVPLAAIADSVLDAVLFNSGTIEEQLFSPSHQELAARVLVSIFILAVVYLGMHFLANISKKERRLQQRNKDLGLIRQAMEEYHDELSLQLRNTSTELATSVEFFKSQCDDTDEKVEFFIENIRKTSAKLQDQLDINLSLAEHSFSELHRERIRIDKLAHEVAEEIQCTCPDRPLEFKIQPWINCWCDRKVMRLVLFQLFSNAIAFIPSSRSGCIEFGMSNRNDRRVLFVRDNGVGFNEAQAKRLFEPFRDITQDPDLPSDTTLLTATRRIIHQHGGQIWAEGVPGAGGTFFFTYC